MNLNKALVYGNLTRDPELRTTPNGVNVCTFSLATNRVYNDRDGVRQEQAEYHNIVVFGKQAENAAKYLKKGNGAFVEGRLQTRSWDKDGVKHYRTEIVADRVQFGPRGGGAPSGHQANTSDKAASSEPASAVPDYPTEEINPEDIPF